jgi:chromosomal replication initiation ATPase DnaA
MYLAHVGLGMNLTEVARVFARDRTTVAHACARIEDRRDAAPFDRALDLLEGALRLVSQRPS